MSSKFNDRIRNKSPKTYGMLIVEFGFVKDPAHNRKFDHMEEMQ